MEAEAVRHLLATAAILRLMGLSALRFALIKPMQVPALWSCWLWTLLPMLVLATNGGTRLSTQCWGTLVESVSVTRRRLLAAAAALLRRPMRALLRVAAPTDS